MIRVPEVLGFDKLTPPAARAALSDFFMQRNSWQYRNGVEMPNSVQADLLFQELVRHGGTAVDFDWLVTMGYCERTDSTVWANALWERFDEREERNED